jgi:hypothetical protein
VAGVSGVGTGRISTRKHRHRSASVGDVIVIGKVAYGIEREGFKKIGTYLQRERKRLLGPSL